METTKASVLAGRGRIPSPALLSRPSILAEAAQPRDEGLPLHSTHRRSSLRLDCGFARDDGCMEPETETICVKAALGPILVP